MSIIRVAGLNKTFGKGEAAAKALKDVHLSIEQGELVAITGPSGCGKTTRYIFWQGLRA